MLNEVDHQILELLQKDAKMTIKEIAAELKLTTTPVHERIKRLERDGLIKRYTVIVDRHKIGLEMLAFCSVSLKNHNREFIKRFEKDVQQLTEVVECYHIGGMSDYLLKVIVRDMAQYQHFVSHKLAGVENIGTVQSSFVMSEIKHSTNLPSMLPA